MTTRPQRRPGQWTLATLIVALLAAVLAVAGPPGRASAAAASPAPAPASAAAANASQQWASLMYRSLTPTPAYLKLRKTLAAQRATLAARTSRLATGKTAHDAAQAALTAAIGADEAARIRSAVARETLVSARNTLTVVAQRRPYAGVAVTGARTAITAAATTVTSRGTQARQAAAALKAAQAAARTSTVTLDAATAAWQSSTTQVRTNQRKLIALDKSAAYAARAAALSQAVVTEIRPGFTVADSTTVYGVTVHRKVAFAFRRMLESARADGVVLSGGGFRTRQRQIALRTINGCPDVWTAPASSCRVPTAIPGRSLHELGLAVDVTAGGRTLTADSAGFRWLVAHAARYGFVNLPSEPWHWSITGG